MFPTKSLMNHLALNTITRKKASVQDAIERDTRTPGCHLTTIASFPKNKILGFQELSSLFFRYSKPDQVVITSKALAAVTSFFQI